MKFNEESFLSPFLLSQFLYLCLLLISVKTMNQVISLPSKCYHLELVVLQYVSGTSFQPNGLTSMIQTHTGNTQQKKKSLYGFMVGNANSTCFRVR